MNRSSRTHTARGDCHAAINQESPRGLTSRLQPGAEPVSGNLGKALPGPLLRLLDTLLNMLDRLPRYEGHLSRELDRSHARTPDFRRPVGSGRRPCPASFGAARIPFAEWGKSTTIASFDSATGNRIASRRKDS